MKRNNDGYFDFDFEIEDGAVSNVWDAFFVRDLKQRKLFLGVITEESVVDLIKFIYQFNKEDKGIEPSERQPILLYITSAGGDVEAGFAAIDAIMISKTPVYTVNVGYEYSMGFLVGLAGHKRYATRNSKYLLHDGTEAVFDSGAKARDRVAFSNKIEERIKELVLSRSKITEKEYNKNLRVEWYMHADEAKEKGFVDCIVGEDCDIDEII
jgi:ATP-dependent Clp protease, protease subunit